MSKPYDTKLVMVVAQKPFTAKTGRFCKLIPLHYEDDSKVSVSDFHNDGEVWWMLTPASATLAQPGRLIIGRIEDALDWDREDADSSRYQVSRESPNFLEFQDGIEIIRLPSDSMERVQDLAEADHPVIVDHPPTPHVLLEWRGYIYGPFNCQNFSENSEHLGNQTVTMELYKKDLTIKRVRLEDFQTACGRFVRNLQAEVSETDAPRQQSCQKRTISYQLLLPRGYDEFVSCVGECISMERLDQALNRLVRDITTRKQRQQLHALLDDLSHAAQKSKDPDSVIKILQEAKALTERQDEAVNKMVDALLSSGFIDDERLKAAEKRYAEQYILEKSAQLQAQIEGNIKIAQDIRRKAEEELHSVEAALSRAREKGHAELQAELATERTKTMEGIEVERVRLEDERRALEAQKETLKGSLREATRELSESSQNVVNRFLTIVPLLRASGILPVRESGQLAAKVDTSHADTRIVESQDVTDHVASFEIPSVLMHHALTDDKHDSISEEVFFNRFVQVVGDCGFSYTRDDLARFHLSVKTSDITIVGGNSGTGKSSLAILYARALAGEEYSDKRPDFLMINVNPAWMEIRDVIGHMNTLEGRFYPSETGMYQHLIFAQEDYTANSVFSAIYPICLDEMNIAQVEHYFGDMIQVLERPLEERRLRCFSRETANTQCPFARWHTLTIAPSVRFIGTVNFDETTRRLSDRLLDRANLIMMRADELPSITLAGYTGMFMATGPRVRLRDYEGWVRDSALPSQLAVALDGIRKPLARVGCPVSPRVYRAVCRFVASAQPVLGKEVALDLQVSQRMLSKIRNLVTQDQYDALDDLEKFLTQSDICSFEHSLRHITSIRSQETAYDFRA